MKGLAAIAWRRGEPWSIEEIDVDPPGPGEVLVEWSAAGLCHSDEHFRSGDRVPEGFDDLVFPLLGGHEGAGVIGMVGPGVTALEVGDHVVASFSPTCGRCRYCASGRGRLCNANKDFMKRGQLIDGTVKHRVDGQDLYLMAKLGTFAERTTVAVDSVVKIDPDVPLAPASLVSCGVSTGWGSAVVRAETSPGDVIVVMGLGGLGISAVQGARVAGAGEIIGIDPFPLRRDVAEKLGATHTAATVDEVRDLIAHLTDGQGADAVVVLPSVVTGTIVQEALSITGKGSICVLVGMGELGERAVPIDIGMFVLYEKELRGSLFGGLDPRSAPQDMLNLYRRGLLDLESMVTTYPFDDINVGLADSLEGRNVRAVLLMPGAVAAGGGS